MAKSDKKGIASFNADLPLGTYFVKELKAPKGYVKSDEIIDIDASNVSNTEKV